MCYNKRKGAANSDAKQQFKSSISWIIIEYVNKKKHLNHWTGFERVFRKKNKTIQLLAVVC